MIRTTIVRRFVPWFLAASAAALCLPRIIVWAQPAALSANSAVTDFVHVCGLVPAGRARCLADLRTDVAPVANPSATHSGYGPSDLQSAYNLPSDRGAGETVALVDAYGDSAAESDLAAYRAYYGLPPCDSSSGCFKKVNQYGVVGSYPPDNSSWDTETDLDLDMVSAVCPYCNILLVEANSDNLSDLLAGEDTAAGSGAVAISNSWSSTGLCATGIPNCNVVELNETSLDWHFDHPGIAITAATGDFGYGVGWPASSPYVIAVAGTSLSRASNARGWSETAWSGSGSGCSLYEPKPSWQSGSCTHRSVGDVSAVADPNTPVAVYDSGGGGWVLVGGTSAASPLIAAVFALGGDTAHVAQDGASYLYSHRQALYDVTSGNNFPVLSDSTLPLAPVSDTVAAAICGYECTAGPGYDGPTGLGTPDGLGAFSVPPPPPCNVNDTAVAPGTSPRAAQTTNLGFTPLSSPVRIADTRTGATDPTSYAGDTICPGAALTIDIPPGEVPADASAIVAQLSAVSPSVGGYLSIYPAGSATPGTSNVDFAAGQDVGNLVTVGLGTDPSDGSLAVTVFNGPAATSGPNTDVTLDLYGYYAPPSANAGDAYEPLTPARVFDTRAGSGQPGEGETLTDGGSIEVPVTGVGGVPSHGVSAVVVNIGVTDTSEPSFIEAYPTGSPPSSPTVNQNWVAGETLSTKAIVRVGSGGSITLSNHDGDVDVVVDIDGYFATPGSSGALFNVLPEPVRLMDTRPEGVAGGASVSLAVSGTQGVPASATAGVLDVVDLATSANYLTVYPAGESVPFAADINDVPADADPIVANAAYATVGSGGDVAIFNGPSTTSTANIVVDEFGYFSG